VQQVPALRDRPPPALQEQVPQELRALFQQEPELQVRPAQ
jgi:hypothetical protein